MGYCKTLVAIGALTALAGAANAGLVTNWDFVVNGISGSDFVASANPGAWSASLLPNGDTVIQGEWDAGDWFIDFDLVFNDDPLVTANYILTNNSGVTQGFVISTTLAVNNPAATFQRGSVSGSIGDNTLLPPFGEGDGATLGALGGPLYTATVNGVGIRTLAPGLPVVALPNGTATVGPASYGIPVLEASAFAPVTEMGIVNAFTITADDSVGLNNTHFRAIPAPGAIALAGMAGLVVGRRRR